jgi:hypothetical protein
MSPIYVPGKVVLAQVSQPLDADAQAYVNAVEVADRERIEDPVRFAINNFVIGCKADGIWTAIKASCILAGARTLTGALVPLVGTAPTNFNFVSGDYNRETGLAGNGTSKYLNSNRNNNADPQNSKHAAVYVPNFPAPGGSFRELFSSQDITTGHTILNRNGGDTAFGTLNNSSVIPAGTSISRAAGFYGISRSQSDSFVFKYPSGIAAVPSNSATPASANIFIGARTASTGLFNGSLAFYSIGESLDLALLGARVTDLINAFAAAIP